MHTRTHAHTHMYTHMHTHVHSPNLGGIHVIVVPILDVLLVHLITVYPPRTILPSQEGEEVIQELPGYKEERKERYEKMQHFLS